jgi:hypothetical protein
MKDFAVCSGVAQWSSVCPRRTGCKRHRMYMLCKHQDNINQNHVMPAFKGKTCVNFVEVEK